MNRGILTFLILALTFSAMAQPYPPPSYYNRYTTTADTNFINGNTLTNLSPSAVNTAVPGITNSVVAINVLTSGVTNDGITDVTIALTNLMGSGGKHLFFPPGSYYLQEIVQPENTWLEGLNATFIYATNAWNTNIFVRQLLHTNDSMTGIRLLDPLVTNQINHPFNYYTGSNTTATTTLSSSSISQFTYWAPIGLRHGLQVCTEGNGVTIFDVKGFSGCGVIVCSIHGIGSQFYGKAHITGNAVSNFCNFFSSGSVGINDPFGNTNMVAFYVPAALTPEYIQWSGLNLVAGNIGAMNTAGNVNWVNSSISQNYYGYADFYGANDHHGTVTGCQIDHNGLSAGGGGPIYIEGSVAGQPFSNCQFRGNFGGITLRNDLGITFKNCTWDTLVFTNISTRAGGKNILVNNNYFGSWNTGGNYVSTDGQLEYHGNSSLDTIPNNDGQAATKVDNADGSGLTNLNASAISSGTVAAGRLPMNVGFLDSTQSWTAANTFGNPGNSFSGNGANLTLITAANIAAGTAGINISGTAAKATGDAAGNTFTTTYATTAYVNSHTNDAVADARLSANVALLNGTSQTFQGKIVSGSASSTTQTNLLNIVTTNNLAVAAVINCSTPYSGYPTNASFTWGLPTGVLPNAVNVTTVFVTNSSGSLITMTPNASWGSHTNGGAWNVTNVTAVQFTAYGFNWTNVISWPLF